ncbi:Proprotein convertase subtilisin/kexin type 7 [Chytridiales sp. JEL 0842]|nr:Proprotein convertase subtilisin/kexin type 7 [Chytridiales sp. JEL 0842]
MLCRRSNVLVITSLWLSKLLPFALLINAPSYTLAAVPPPSTNSTKVQWAVQLHNTQTSKLVTPEEAELFAQKHDFTYLGPVGDLNGFYLFEAEVHDGQRVEDVQNISTYSPSSASKGELPVRRLRRRSLEDVDDIFMGNERVKWFEQQQPRKRYKREFTTVMAGHDSMPFKDPNFKMQWHLFNDGVNGVHRGNDINVLPVWRRGINGSGVTVSIIDDGIEYNHPDFIHENWSSESSYDFNERTNKPLPQTPEDTHGTRCAGEIVSAPNDICGVGVAYGARLAGERLIAESTTDAVEAQAFNYKFHINDIYSSSWGPNDDGASLDGPGYLGTHALQLGVQNGRGGRGSIFVFASGNGGLEGDNCNFDGYANSPYTVAIGAINNAGKMPPYGELCSAHLAVTYSGGNGLGIWTTDRDHECTGVHSGTSAAAPLASGMIALMLSARPELGWRDVQQIIVQTAQMTDPTDPDWITNGAGRNVSHKYGFGRLNAELLVMKALTHQLLPSPALLISKSSHPNKRIPTTVTSTDGKNGLEDSLHIGFDDLKSTGLAYLEHVQVTVRLRHPERRHLTIILVSPSGTPSTLAVPRFKDDSSEGFDPWTFMTVRSWGEAPMGTWTLKVMDARSGDRDPYTGEMFETGELVEWTLQLHGTCSKHDIIIDRSTGLGKCAHTVVSAEKSARARVLLYFVGVGIVIMLLAAILVWRRVAFRRRIKESLWPGSGGGRLRNRKARYSPASHGFDGIDGFDVDGDIESPNRSDLLDSPSPNYPKYFFDSLTSGRPALDNRSQQHETRSSLLPTLLRGLEPYTQNANVISPQSPTDVTSPVTDDGNSEFEDENSPVRQQPRSSHTRSRTTTSSASSTIIGDKTYTVLSKPPILRIPSAKSDLNLSGMRSRSCSVSNLNAAAAGAGARSSLAGEINKTRLVSSSRNEMRDGAAVPGVNDLASSGAGRILAPGIASLFGGTTTAASTSSTTNRHRLSSGMRKGQSASDLRKNE